jgi:hypothetical protein
MRCADRGGSGSGSSPRRSTKPELAVLLQDPELRERELREAIRSTRQIQGAGPAQSQTAIGRVPTRSLTQDSSRRPDADASPPAALRCVAVGGATASSRALPAARLDASASHESLGSGS